MDAADRLLACGYQPQAVNNVRALAGWRFDEPSDIGRLLDQMSYESDWMTDYRIRSAQSSLMRPRIMCLNAAILAYALLDAFPQVRRTLLVLHRRGPDGVECGHAATAWWDEHGRIGAFSKSGFAALKHRAPAFASLDELALSFAGGYVGMGFTPLYYGSLRLEETGEDWRFGRRPMPALLERLTDAYAYAFDINAVAEPACQSTEADL